jgi:osmoprotectant transport system ATP-binding protein
MIKLEKVDKLYGEHQALKAVDLHVFEGECVILIGPSGCGKSTLLKSINRMVDINGGRVIVAGRNVNDYQPELLRRQIGYCIQGVGLFPHLSVQDNIAVVPRLMKWNEKQIRERTLRLMAISELPPAYLDKYPHELSGGEAQRVGVCRALAADPPILLMDEPFGAVDPLTREKLQTAFNNIQRELRKTVVFVTHDVEEAIVLGDRIAVMNQGEVLLCGTPGAMTDSLLHPFVKTFLGSDYPLRLLNRYTLVDLSGTSAQPAAREDMNGSGLSTGDNPVYTLKDTTTLKEILSELIRQNAGGLTLELPGGNRRTVTYADIASFLREVSKQ